MKTPRTRAEMVSFLAGHFRYSTMNSWNGSSSYAANVKLRELNIPRELQDRAYEMLEIEGAFDGVNQVLEEFAVEHGWAYQIGFNGRSGGYLVLYSGGRKQSDYKSVCTQCGQRNYKTVEETAGAKCGRCGKDARVNHTFFETYTTGKGLGASAEEMAEWSMDELRAEVKLVREFDAAVEDARAAFIETVKENTVEEETYTVQKTRKILAPRGA